MKSINFLLNDKVFYLIFPSVFVLISMVLVFNNGSFLFEYSFLNKFGDQHHYYSLAYNLAHLDFPKSLYTLGYSLFYLPAILLTGTKEHWSSIMDIIIPLQSLFIVPTYIYFIFRNKSKQNALIAFGLLLVYYLLLALLSKDSLIDLNFFGLIPLSEPLAVFFLIMGYVVYLHHVYRLKEARVKISSIVLLSFFVAGGLMIRNTLLILFLPILIDMFFARRIRSLSIFSILAALFYSPQIVYNYLCSGDILFNGYSWWAGNKTEKNTKSIKALYGVTSHSMFSLKYLAVNLRNTVYSYAPLLVLIGYLRIIKSNRLTNLVIVFSIINLLFHLSYWWSAAGGLIDRFLLPNVLLLLFMINNDNIRESNENKL